VTVGSLLPSSAEGVLGDIATHHERAVEAAVEHANSAGGLQGREVVHVAGDTAASPDAAADAYDELVAEDPVAIVGAVVSGVSATLAERAAEDGRLLVSPASTSPALASAGRTDDAKFFARTCPNDRQQATVVAKVVDDGAYADADTVGVLHLDDAFGTALANTTADALDADVATTVSFPGSPDDPAAPVDDVLDDDPDAVAFLGTPGPSTAVLEALVAREYDGDVVLSSGLVPSNPSPNFNGVYTASVADANTVGTKRLRRQLSDVAPLLPYSTNAYDAAFLPLLAAEYAGDADPAAAAGALQSVSGGVGHSVTVGDFDRAATLVDAGRDLNYQGASGSVDMNADLEPVSSYLVQQLGDAGLQTLELLKHGFFANGSGGGGA
jgi:ABC-type branched-subunit amino acid transport system substrate-binding protein